MGRLKYALPVLALLLFACAKAPVEWEVPIPSVPVGWKQRGLASWYGPKFHGKRTASGEIFNMYSMTAAHRTLPLGTYVRVKNLKNGRTVIVKINDRGPFVKGRIIDLSYEAARRLGMIKDGVVPVEITVIGTPSSWGRYFPYFGVYYVQVGAFKYWSNAVRMALKMKRYKLPVEIRPVYTNSSKFYRVLVGPYSKVGATKVAYMLRRKGYETAVKRE